MAGPLCQGCGQCVCAGQKGYSVSDDNDDDDDKIIYDNDNNIK